MLNVVDDESLPAAKRLRLESEEDPLNNILEVLKQIGVEPSGSDFFSLSSDTESICSSCDEENSKGYVLDSGLWRSSESRKNGSSYSAHSPRQNKTAMVSSGERNIVYQDNKLNKQIFNVQFENKSPHSYEYNRSHEIFDGSEPNDQTPRFPYENDSPTLNSKSLSKQHSLVPHQQPCLIDASETLSGGKPEIPKLDLSKCRDFYRTSHDMCGPPSFMKQVEMMYTENARIRSAYTAENDYSAVGYHKKRILQLEKTPKKESRAKSLNLKSPGSSKGLSSSYDGSDSIRLESDFYIAAMSKASRISSLKGFARHVEKNSVLNPSESVSRSAAKIRRKPGDFAKPTVSSSMKSLGVFPVRDAVVSRLDSIKVSSTIPNSALHRKQMQTQVKAVHIAQRVLKNFVSPFHEERHTSSVENLKPSNSQDSVPSLASYLSTIPLQPSPKYSTEHRPSLDNCSKKERFKAKFLRNYDQNSSFSDSLELSSTCNFSDSLSTQSQRQKNTMKKTDKRREHDLISKCSAQEHVLYKKITEAFRTKKMDPAVLISLMKQIFMSELSKPYSLEGRKPVLQCTKCQVHAQQNPIEIDKPDHAVSVKLEKDVTGSVQIDLTSEASVSKIPNVSRTVSPDVETLLTSDSQTYKALDNPNEALSKVRVNLAKGELLSKGVDDEKKVSLKFYQDGAKELPSYKSMEASREESIRIRDDSLNETPSGRMAKVAEKPLIVRNKKQNDAAYETSSASKTCSITQKNATPSSEKFARISPNTSKARYIEDQQLVQNSSSSLDSNTKYPCNLTYAPLMSSKTNFTTFNPGEKLSPEQLWKSQLRKQNVQNCRESQPAHQNATEYTAGTISRASLPKKPSCAQPSQRQDVLELPKLNQEVSTNSFLYSVLTPPTRDTAKSPVKLEPKYVTPGIPSERQKIISSVAPSICFSDDPYYPCIVSTTLPTEMTNVGSQSCIAFTKSKSPWSNSAQPRAAFTVPKKAAKLYRVQKKMFSNSLYIASKPLGVTSLSQDIYQYKACGPRCNSNKWNPMDIFVKFFNNVRNSFKKKLSNEEEKIYLCNSSNSKIPIQKGGANSYTESLPCYGRSHCDTNGYQTQGKRDQQPILIPFAQQYQPKTTGGSTISCFPHQQGLAKTHYTYNIPVASTQNIAPEHMLHNSYTSVSPTYKAGLNKPQMIFSVISPSNKQEIAFHGVNPTESLKVQGAYQAVPTSTYVSTEASAKCHKEAPSQLGYRYGLDNIVQDDLDKNSPCRSYSDISTAVNSINSVSDSSTSTSNAFVPPCSSSSTNIAFRHLLESTVRAEPQPTHTSYVVPVVQNEYYYPKSCHQYPSISSILARMNEKHQYVTPSHLDQVVACNLPLKTQYSTSYYPLYEGPLQFYTGVSSCVA